MSGGAATIDGADGATQRWDATEGSIWALSRGDETWIVAGTHAADVDAVAATLEAALG